MSGLGLGFLEQDGTFAVLTSTIPFYSSLSLRWISNDSYLASQRIHIVVCTTASGGRHTVFRNRSLMFNSKVHVHTH